MYNDFGLAQSLSLYEGMMTNLNLPKVEKKTYSKPKLTEVKLVAKEAVLDVCKNGDDQTPGCINVCVDIAGS